MPTIAVNDFEAVLPDDLGAVRTDAIDLALEATEPLRTYRVTVRGRGQAYDDPAALLRGEAGQTRRADDGAGVDDGGHAVPISDHAAIRDPVHGVGHRHCRRP